MFLWPASRCLKSGYGSINGEVTEMPKGIGYPKGKPPKPKKGMRGGKKGK